VDDLLNRHDLTDEEWERLMPAHPRQGHRWNDHRTVIDGILFRTRSARNAASASTESKSHSSK